MEDDDGALRPVVPAAEVALDPICCVRAGEHCLLQYRNRVVVSSQNFNIADAASERNAIVSRSSQELWYSAGGIDILLMQVQLSANLVDADPSAQKMVVDWNIKYDCERIGCPDIGLYFDA